MSEKVLLCFLVLCGSVRAETQIEKEAAAFLRQFDTEASERMYQYSLASWAYNTNITKENSDKLSEQGQIWTTFYNEKSDRASKFKITDIKDPQIKLQLIILQDKGAGILPQEKAAHLSKILSDMSTIYSTTSVCMMDNPHNCQTLEPGLEHVMATSRNYSELLHVWEGWRREVGKKMRPLYEDYVILKNEAAKLNNFEDYGAYWRYNYETIDEESPYNYNRHQLMEDVRSIYKQILPLYKELHAYVRDKLMKVHGNHMDQRGPLPANLLGDMWGRFWTNLYPLAMPYEGEIDVSTTMVEKGWTKRRLFEEAEKFFMSVGLYEMYDNFWDNSMLEKPEDGRKVVCHPTAWDMGNTKDYRIKMCTQVNMENFLTVHHEMGHNQYQMAYRNLSYLLRDGANEGFHEAVGEIMSLSAATPKHLKALGLLPPDYTYDNETEINFLLKQALTIVATLPFTYMLEEWRWQVFAGNIPEEKWMERWWEMKRDLVGVVEPVPRDETYCDPAALFHVSGDYSFIRYFTRTIYQFQFQKALCHAAGQSDVLSSCDITGSKEAGAKLKSMLELGRSKSWTRALHAISGDTRMDARPLLDYFQKLYVWLKEDNMKHNRYVGWDAAVDPYSKDAIKVRLSLKMAMGDEAYSWNSNEQYLFRASVAYALRQYYSQKNNTLLFTAENVLTYKQTPRISFYMVVTNPVTPSQFVPKEDLKAAIRLSRGRINDAFQLDDHTLEFDGIPATLSPPVEQPVEVWLVVFGVVMAVVVLMGLFLIISGIIERKKKSKNTGVENPYEPDGQTNRAYEESRDEQTGL
ncbi:angiotensin-converting enzyme 2 [Corythoichthys intestinalis]|uniref:angiotensin-converting enzyme 2 n=1 Tax=Corythoichthys intestinalis TaxID=161448 RepID=UPI0025A638F7|nr:angiotensin-converting enzyme 2 [Corythoichthys intestinalis]XP_061796715.1 angiotensin-converting enzyme 2-like [Nerophis lumbriciformis]